MLHRNTKKEVQSYPQYRLNWLINLKYFYDEFSPSCISNFNKELNAKIEASESCFTGIISKTLELLQRVGKITSIIFKILQLQTFIILWLSLLF